MQRRVVWSALILIMCTAPAAAQNCNVVPNSFLANTAASASQVNSNFGYFAGCSASIASPSFTGNASFTGLVGIGTTTPGSQLQVNAPSSATSGTVSAIDMTGNQSAASSGNYIGLLTSPTYNASGTLAALEGANLSPQNTGSGIVTTLSGAVLLPINSSTGTVTSLRGITSNPQNAGGAVASIIGVYSVPQEASGASGGTTNIYGMFAQPEVNGTYAITNMKSLYANCVNANASATVTNCYELYLDTPTLTGAISHVYGVYQNYGSATNYFAGSVGIGIVPSSTPLLQVGSSSLSTTAAVAVLQNGTAACTHTPAAGTETVACSSDLRLKKDIDDAKTALPGLTDMRIRDFTVRATGGHATGVIAQEMLNTHPDMVHKGSDGFYKVDGPNPWVLVKAIQELKSSNDQQATQISAQAAQITALRNDLNKLEESIAVRASSTEGGRHRVRMADSHTGHPTTLNAPDSFASGSIK